MLLILVMSRRQFPVTNPHSLPPFPVGYGGISVCPTVPAPRKFGSCSEGLELKGPRARRGLLRRVDDGGGKRRPTSRTQKTQFFHTFPLTSVPPFPGEAKWFVFALRRPHDAVNLSAPSGRSSFERLPRRAARQHVRPLLPRRRLRPPPASLRHGGHLPQERFRPATKRSQGLCELSID